MSRSTAASPHSVCPSAPNLWRKGEFFERLTDPAWRKAVVPVISGTPQKRKAETVVTPSRPFHVSDRVAETTRLGLTATLTISTEGSDR